jgi:epsilon-lactone hydrolase
MSNHDLSLPARFIPVPSTVSPEAQKFLGTPAPERAAAPPIADKAAWRAHAAEADRNMQSLLAPLEGLLPARIESTTVGSAVLYEVTPNAVNEQNKSRAILYFHGGGYYTGGGRSCALMALTLAVAAGCTVYSSDYRMPPDYPYPAAIDDGVAAYRHVISRVKPSHLAVAGISAGGGLAAAVTLKVRDLGLPLPAAALLVTPESDLTESGDTFQTNRYLDIVLPAPIPDSIALYADGHDLFDPYLSPIYGDFTKGFPPTILVSGTRDLFLSNTVNFHRALRRANIETDLHVFEAMPHGGFRGAPEDAESIAEQVRFLATHLATG